MLPSRRSTPLHALPCRPPAAHRRPQAIPTPGPCHPYGLLPKSHPHAHAAAMPPRCRHNTAITLPYRPHTQPQRRLHAFSTLSPCSRYAAATQSPHCCNAASRPPYAAPTPLPRYSNAAASTLLHASPRPFRATFKPPPRRPGPLQQRLASSRFHTPLHALPSPPPRSCRRDAAPTRTQPRRRTHDAATLHLHTAVASTPPHAAPHPFRAPPGSRTAACTRLRRRAYETALPTPSPRPPHALLLPSSRPPHALPTLTPRSINALPTPEHMPPPRRPHVSPRTAATPPRRHFEFMPPKMKTKFASYRASAMEVAQVALGRSCVTAQLRLAPVDNDGTSPGVAHMIEFFSPAFYHFSPCHDNYSPNHYNFSPSYLSYPVSERVLYSAIQKPFRAI